MVPTMAGIKLGPNVYEFPWVRKWAMMCIDLGSREGAERVREVCSVLNKAQQAEVIKEMKWLREGAIIQTMS